MTAKPLTLADLRDEMDRFRAEIHRELSRYATKADLKDLETKLTLRLLGVVGTATGIIIAVDRLWP